MKLDIENWKEFRTDKIFRRFEIGKGNQQIIEDGDDCFYVGAKRDDNGVMRRCRRDDSLISEGNCIVFICNGEGSVGYAIYIDRDFIGTTDIVCGYCDMLNEKIGAFLATVYSLERPKYSFGRKWKIHLASTIVKLPVRHNADGTIYIDEAHSYSDGGYVPDWHFMEEYIKSLHCKTLTTKNGENAQALGVEKWMEFKVGDILTILNGKGITKEEIADNPGGLTVVQSGEENNGVLGMIDKDYCVSMKYTISDKPCLTVARSGSAGFVSFQVAGCVVGDSAKILLLPEDVATTPRYLFIQAVLSANRFKYAYGRKVTEDKYRNDVIVLPVRHGRDGLPVKDETKRFSAEGYVPDWEFMEKYIKSLPYGDKLASPNIES